MDQSTTYSIPDPPKNHSGQSVVPRRTIVAVDAAYEDKVSSGVLPVEDQATAEGATCRVKLLGEKYTHTTQPELLAYR